MMVTVKQYLDVHLSFWELPARYITLYHCLHSIIFPTFLITWLIRKISWTRLPLIKTKIWLLRYVFHWEIIENVQLKKCFSACIFAWSQFEELIAYFQSGWQSILQITNNKHYWDMNHRLFIRKWQI